MSSCYRTFVKRFVLRYRTIVCLSVWLRRWCIVANGWMHQDATWYGGRPRPRPRCVRWGPSFPQKGHSSPPQFSAHACCGQTVGWIKIPLGKKVGLQAQATLCQMRTQLPSKKVAYLPTFRPMSIVAKRRPSQQLRSSCYLGHYKYTLSQKRIPPNHQR